MRRAKAAPLASPKAFGPAAKWLLGATVALAVAFAGRGAYQRVQHRRLLARVQQAYVRADCSVTSKEVHVTTHLDRGRKQGQRRTHAVFEPVVRYRYRVGERDFEGERFSPEPPREHERARTEELLRRYEVGKTYPCWHDPDRPDEAFLERQGSDRPGEVLRREEPEP